MTHARRDVRASGDTTDPAHILDLLLEYRAAEQRRRAKAHGEMRMGETDQLALRYLLEAQAAGQLVRQKDLAQRLGVSTPSVSGLVDRLTRDGYLRRIPHPEDRRSVAIELTATTEDKVHTHQHQMNARVLEAVESLTPTEYRAVDKFLTGLVAGLDRPGAD